MSLICADDYGLSEGINAAILELGHANRISATSVMIDRITQNDVDRLLAAGLQIGLHLELFRRPFYFSKKKIKQEIRSQLQKFLELFKQGPNFIDGHQHCHIYPIISTCLLEVVSESQLRSVWIRSLTLPDSIRRRGTLSKRIYVEFLQMLNVRLKKELLRANIPTNNLCFGSLNEHMSAIEIHSLFEEESAKNDLFFFHPSLVDELDLNRRQEFELFR